MVEGEAGIPSQLDFMKFYLKKRKEKKGWVCWHTSLIRHLEWLSELRGQPGLQSSVQGQPWLHRETLSQEPKI